MRDLLQERFSLGYGVRAVEYRTCESLFRRRALD
jgi:hypothetical protein